MSYNIRHGVGEDDQLSLARIAGNIQRSEATIIGIQELDKYFGERSEHQDQAKVLAEQLNMNHVYGANLILQPLASHGEERKFGTAILTHYPIIESKNTHLCSFGQEQRGLLRVLVDIDGVHVNVYNTHLTDDNETIRTKQIEEIIKIISDDSGPKILMGDFNAEPESDELALLKNKTSFIDVFENKKDAHTFSSGNPTIRIDYIFASPDLICSKQEVIHTSGSDHLPITASLKLK